MREKNYIHKNKQFLMQAAASPQAKLIDLSHESSTGSNHPHPIDILYHSTPKLNSAWSFLEATEWVS